MLTPIINLTLILLGLFHTATSCQAQGHESLSPNAASSIPAQIRVPGGNSPALLTHAIGNQIYQCALVKESYTWVLLAPDAKLVDVKGQVVGKHYSGPIWEYQEGSRIEGRIVSKLDVDPDSSISWLLVKVIAHKGKGLLSDISYINRINTRGGLTPSSGCNTNHLGTEKRVAYSADYVFYK
jgi:hypothetical protein